MDLYEFVKANSTHSYASGAGSTPEFSVEAIASLVGVSNRDIRVQKWRRRLKGYDADSVREYLLKTSRKSVAREIRREFREQLRQLRQEVRRLRRLLKSLESAKGVQH